MKKTIFKAYDIRGVYPNEINEDVAYQIGKSYGSYLQDYCDKKKCVVGRDNRISSPALSQALIKGLLDSGINVIDYGMITTPMHYLTRHIENTFGIMVTASHNPKEDNGFKFSFDPFANARGEMIEEFMEYTVAKQFKSGNGLYEKRDILDTYKRYMLDNIFMGYRPLKVVIDCGNGVTANYVKEIHDLFPNLNVTYICSESDGTFPNHHPDPAVEDNMAMLKEEVLSHQADLGIAYDGDGDRIGIIDNLGRFLPADKYMIVPIRTLLKQFDNKTILCDVKCSKTLTDEIEKLGGRIFMSRTGTSFTQANTKQQNIPIGIELSGHVFFNDRGIEIGSSMYAGLRLLEILSKTDQSFSQLLEGITSYYSTPEIKIEVGNDKKFQIVEQVTDYVRKKRYQFLNIDGVRITFDNSWALIRASNTGPHLTLRFEATEEQEFERIQKEFIDLVHTLSI